MNVNDVDEKTFSHVLDNTDRLGAIFARQKELMDKYGPIERKNGFWYPHVIPMDMHSRHSQHYAKDMSWRITEELGEAMNCLKNKPWKSTHMLTDLPHFYEEIADAFHFFIELCILIGLDEQAIFEIYFRKSEVNRFRQRSNY
jgi:hypothetical protein